MYMPRIANAAGLGVTPGSRRSTHHILYQHADTPLRNLTPDDNRDSQ